MKLTTPGFKSAFSIIGISFVVLASSLFAKGLLESMGEFQVPQETLQSPHYQDAITWVYIHMIVMGFLVFMLGRFVKEQNNQKIVTVTFLIAIIFYTYLDIRTSDSSLGNGLYKGNSSFAPALINGFYILLLVGTIIKLYSSKK